MSIAVLAVRQRGTAATSQVFRHIGTGAPIAVGPNFSIMGIDSYNGAVAGDTIQGAGSGATAKITAVFGGNTLLALSNIVGTFIDIETCNNLTHPGNTVRNRGGVGILETSFGGPNAGFDHPSNRVLAFAGSLYCFMGTYIWKLPNADPANDWVIVYSLANGLPITGGIGTQYHTGLHVLYVNGAPILGALYGNTNNNHVYRIASSDGTTWTEATIFTGTAFAGQSPPFQELVLNNVLYVRAPMSGFNVTHMTWDPATDVGSINTNLSIGQAVGLFPSNGALYTYLINGGNANIITLHTLTGATWSPTSIVLSGNATGGNSTTTFTGFDPGDGFFYMVVPHNTNSGYGWTFRKIQLLNGAYTDLGDVSPTVLAGTGIPSHATFTDPTFGRWYIVQDNVTNPGSIDTYLYYAANDGAGNPVTALKWNGPSAPMTLLGVFGDITNALPMTFLGGGERIWGPGQPDIIMDQFSTVPTGIQITYRVFGGGTRTVAFYYGQNVGPPPAQATLASPSTGSLVGKTVVGVPANGTSQTVVWVAGPSGDNVTNLAAAQLQPEVLA